MYAFAIFAMVALAVIKLVDFAVDHLDVKESGFVRSLLTFIVALGGVWIIDFSLFDEWSVAVRTRAIGVWATGLMVAGATVAWRALFGYLTHDRATVDETLGERRELKKVA
ncbi:MAG: hypothetical protein KatS3mg008_1849 [Acidimicrobiales bacterium]|nr:MAG: hypothetical protein KatS3mg008_1849 [Acidimicrobiales bacterium]